MFHLLSSIRKDRELRKWLQNKLYSFQRFRRGGRFVWRKKEQQNKKDYFCNVVLSLEFIND